MGFRKSMKGAPELSSIPQWVRHVLHKHEGLNEDAHTPQQTAAFIYNPRRPMSKKAADRLWVSWEAEVMLTLGRKLLNQVPFV